MTIRIGPILFPFSSPFDSSPASLCFPFLILLQFVPSSTFPAYQDLPSSCGWQPHTARPGVVDRSTWGNHRLIISQTGTSSRNPTVAGLSVSDALRQLLLQWSLQFFSDKLALAACICNLNATSGSSENSTAYTVRCSNPCYQANARNGSFVVYRFSSQDVGNSVDRFNLTHRPLLSIFKLPYMTTHNAQPIHPRRRLTIVHETLLARKTRCPSERTTLSPAAPTIPLGISDGIQTGPSFQTSISFVYRSVPWSSPYSIQSLWLEEYSAQIALFLLYPLVSIAFNPSPCVLDKTRLVPAG